MKILAIIAAVIIYLVVIIFTWKDGYKNGKHDGAVDEQIECTKRIKEILEEKMEAVKASYAEGLEMGERNTLRLISPPHLYELSKKMTRIAETTILSDDAALENSKKITEAQDVLISKIKSYINYEIEHTYMNEIKYKVWLTIIDEKTDKGEPFDLKEQQKG